VIYAGELYQRSPQPWGFRDGVMQRKTDPSGISQESPVLHRGDSIRRRVRGANVGVTKLTCLALLCSPGAPCRVAISERISHAWLSRCCVFSLDQIGAMQARAWVWSGNSLENGERTRGGCRYGTAAVSIFDDFLS